MLGETEKQNIRTKASKSRHAKMKSLFEAQNTTVSKSFEFMH